MPVSAAPLRLPVLGEMRGVYTRETQETAERFYSGEWLTGVRACYGTEPKITYFETVALTDKATGQAGGLD